MSAHDEVAYEYWCDGERIRVFDNKAKAMRHYELRSKQAPTSLHTVFKVVPSRKPIIQWVP